VSSHRLHLLSLFRLAPVHRTIRSKPCSHRVACRRAPRGGGAAAAWPHLDPPHRRRETVGMGGMTSAIAARFTFLQPTDATSLFVTYDLLAWAPPVWVGLHKWSASYNIVNVWFSKGLSDCVVQIQIIMNDSIHFLKRENVHQF
jgi:hypothetical protein